MTQAERVGCRMAASMYEVMGMVRWDRLQYCVFKYNAGMLYLAIYFQGDKGSIDIMQRSSAFWGWWKVQWMAREQEWLKQWYAHDCYGRLPVNMLASSYRMMNNARDLANVNMLPGAVLDDSYCRDLVPMLK